MIDRRRLLLSAAAGAGLAAAHGQAFALNAPAGDAAQSKAALAAFMDQAFEQTLDLSPETVTAFGLDTGARAAAKSQLTVPTPENEEKFRAFTKAQRAALSALDRSSMDAQDGIYFDTIADNLDGVIATFAIPYGQGGWPNPYRVSQQGGA